MERIIKLLEERLELADKRTFETIYLTIKPEEAEELLKILKESL